MDREHGTVWVAIWNTVELAHKGVGEALLTSLKIQVSKIDPFTNNVESEVQVSINRLREVTYKFSQLCQKIEFL